MKKIVVVALVVLALGMIITYQLKNSKHKKKAEIRYVPYTTQISDVKEIIDTTGEVSALNRVEIKPSVAGRVDTLLVNEGDVVKKGQVLAYLSSSDRVAILDAVRANPDEKLSDWENTYKATPVISPMNGRIILRNVVEGQTISTGDILFALADELIILASVDEADIGKIKNGQKASITLDAYKDISITGKVFQILEEGQNVSNVITYYVKIRPDKTPDFFKSLMTANIDITIAEKKNAVVIPWDSFYEDEQGNSYVFVQDGNMQRRRKDITTGILDGDFIEVKSGLSVGDTILIKQNAYNISTSKNTAKGFLSVDRKRKTNKEILGNSSSNQVKK